MRWTEAQLAPVRKKYSASGSRKRQASDPLAEIDRAVASIEKGIGELVRPSSVHDAEVNALLRGAKLPSWLLRLLDTDNDLVLASASRKATRALVKSVHKLRLGEAIRDPKKINDTRQAEHWLQVRLFYMLERYHSAEYPLIFAVPNGGHRSHNSALTMQREGQKRGVPDIVLPLPRGIYHGMYLEVKTEIGTPSPDQKRMMSLLAEQGYYVVCGKGFDECWRLITDYLLLPLFDNLTDIDKIDKK
jgi:hypothetical protein